MEKNNPHQQIAEINKDQKNKTPKKISAKLQKTPLWLVVLLAVIGVFVVISIAVLLWFYSVVYAVRTDVGVNGQIFEVTQGSSVSDIAAQLASKDLISNPTAFEVYAKLGPAHGKLIPGPYLVRPSSSIASIVADMSSGKIAQNKITYPEGITINDMAKRFEAAGYGSKDEYLAAVKQEAPNYSFIPIGSRSNPEGYLFPSTYTFIPGRGATELVKKQFSAFETQMVPLLQGPKPGNLNANQVLTLASIVEKEALTEKDRKLVAGVFLNRLAKGMKLESDVTVNYGSGKTQTSAADVLVATPYNTYKIAGLTPTPVNNPSTDSVEAVLNYTPNDYIFFLAGTDGKVYYAKTLVEHNENIKNHL